MKKRVFIIHEWGGNPNEGWIPWLKKELKNSGYEVQTPLMPDTMCPKIKNWVSKINAVVGKPDKYTYLVGHSIGCQAIMRYIEKLPPEIKIGGAVFVAGWFNLTDETWDEDYKPEIAKPWIDTPIDFRKIKSHANKFVAIYSDNDPYVPVSDSGLFKEKLGAKLILEKGKGYITGEDGVLKLPEARDYIMKISK